ncbi:hypothetical protein [Acidithiobacillus ferrivorans]|uniref:Uncharacterized protein n=1 Tax=Acidithiobacillus ferrivorans TaxID=160808 RepID=A0A7T4WB84_9PROT|nr:hypothetical protein [Acidithiobacillus ferrivorans]QQD71406.1 hypothetical protein H2515_05080 [Acidithiobacillus ferrivorans]
MIPITPDIIGPGIEEEYADALERIDFLYNKFKPYPESNDTPQGRLLLSIGWFKREITGQHLPIPVDKSHRHTIAYMYTNGDLGGPEQGNTDDVDVALGELLMVLDGDGLIKKRHYPVVISQINDFAALVAQNVEISDILPIEKEALAQLNKIKEQLTDHEIDLPVSKNDYPAWKDPTALAHFNDRGLPNGWAMRKQITLSVFSGYTPYPAKKPPLPAPHPRLTQRAANLSPVRDWLVAKTGTVPQAMAELNQIMRGRMLEKSDYPTVVNQINHYLKRVDRYVPAQGRSPATRSALTQMREIMARLHHHEIDLPVELDQYPELGEFTTLAGILDKHDADDWLYFNEIYYEIFYARCPNPVWKGAQ